MNCRYWIYIRIVDIDKRKLMQKTWNVEAARRPNHSDTQSLSARKKNASMECCINLPGLQ